MQYTPPNHVFYSRVRERTARPRRLWFLAIVAALYGCGEQHSNYRDDASPVKSPAENRAEDDVEATVTSMFISTAYSCDSASEEILRLLCFSLAINDVYEHEFLRVDSCKCVSESRYEYVISRVGVSSQRLDVGVSAPPTTHNEELAVIAFVPVAATDLDANSCSSLVHLRDGSSWCVLLDVDRITVEPALTVHFTSLVQQLPETSVTYARFHEKISDALPDIPLE